MCRYVCMYVFSTYIYTYEYIYIYIYIYIGFSETSKLSLSTYPTTGHAVHCTKMSILTYCGAPESFAG